MGANGGYAGKSGTISNAEMPPIAGSLFLVSLSDGGAIWKEPSGLALQAKSEAEEQAKKDVEEEKASRFEGIWRDEDGDIWTIAGNFATCKDDKWAITFPSKSNIEMEADGDMFKGVLKNGQ